MRSILKVLKNHTVKNRISIIVGMVFLVAVGVLAVKYLTPQDIEINEFEKEEEVDFDLLSANQKEALATITLEDSLLDEVADQIATHLEDENFPEKRSSFEEEEQALIELERETYQWNGRDLAAGKAVLRQYDPEDWRYAVEQGLHSAIIFYTEDCESCNQELEEVVIPAFEEFGDDVVLGFVVRYDPGELTRQATQLASRFGVANENTKIFAQFSQAALRRIEGFTEKEILKDRIRELWRS